MAVFAYVARDDSGKMIEGEVSAASQAEAARLVRSEGKFVVRVAPKRAGAAAATKPSATAKGSFFTTANDKFRPKDLIYFTNQLAVMIDTGVSMNEALEACVHEGNSPRFARALGAVIERVEGGAELSSALAEHPRVFPQLYVSLIRASEASGMMGPILRRLAEHLEQHHELKRKIRGAVTYPIVMFLFAIGVTVFLLTFVLPKFTRIYAGREDKLPAITRWLLAFSDHLTTFGPYLLGVLVVGVVALIWYLRTENGKRHWDGLKLRLPLVGNMFHKSCLARSLRTLGTMIQSGVSMLESVKLTSGVSGSRNYEQMWTEVYGQLEKGRQLSEALGENRNVPKAVNKMLHAGERSGQLGAVMERVAIFCEQELNAAIKAFTSLLEPAIVMFLGVVVGGLVLALLLPIFTISKALR